VRRKRGKIRFVILGIIVLILFFISYFLLPNYFAINYQAGDRKIAAAEVKGAAAATIPTPTTHLATPSVVKAIYVSSWVAGTPSFRQKLIDLVDSTEINTVVIDIKDATGLISFRVNDPKLKSYGSDSSRIADLDSLISTLHQKNIYIIGRVSTFQDPFMVQSHPELAVKRSSDGNIWRDHKGLSWIDAGAKDNWDYLVLIGKEAYNRGFDEINYDYIRYPTDGDMTNISYPFSNDKAKHAVISEFFAYLTSHLKPTGAKASADLFGLTTIAEDDLGIGQVLTDALQYFDYVAPMVYPSHFYAGTDGFKNPADHPYDIIKYSMSSGIQKALAASSSPDKLRPWLQAFDLGAVYTPEMIRSQIQATYDVGLKSWMLWDAANQYTAAKSALLKE
jgi:hypothetical protein